MWYYVTGDLMFFKKKEATYSWLIVGLGNPGAQYAKTRHNAGFMAIDLLADALGCKFAKTKFDAILADANIEGEKVLLAKPQTFMNNSGLSVGKISAFYKIPIDKIIVIFDDTSLDVGKIRLRKSGTHGGHNGLKSIFEHCKSNDIKRVKIGVGAKPHPEYDLKDWVLGKFSPSDLTPLKSALDNSVLAVKETVINGIESAMNKYNG